MLARTLAAALLASAPAFGQCDLLDFDFDAEAVGTPLDNLPGWTDRISGVDTRIALSPGANSPSVQLLGSVAQRRLSNLALPDLYQVRFRATVLGHGRFRLVCPTVVQNGAWIDDTRLDMRFGAFPGETPAAHLNDTGLSTPIQIGVPFDVVLDIDTTSGATVHVDGVSLGYVPWASTPGPCTSPADLFWESSSALPGGQPNAGWFIDDVCVGTNGALVGCTALPNSTGSAATLTGPAVVRVSQGSLQLQGRGLPPLTPALLLMSEATIPPTPLLGGNLCLGTPLARVLDSLQFADAGGLASHRVDLGDPLPHPYAQSGAPAYVTAGDTFAFQVYFRDVQAPTRANLSTAVQVTFVP